jgi:NAD(P)-dependent dehydrogenase (short-subunit alcohol dehydrogenase family)
MPTPLRCDPALFQKDLKDQVVIVTGANSGCGLETARQLSQQGATVILACRNEQRGKEAAQKVNGVFLACMDLSSLDSIRSFVQVFQEQYNRLDVLVNNAGVMACPYQKTQDNFEWQLGCNHLGHFLLTSLLTPLLLQTAQTTGKPSRMVCLSSCAAAQSILVRETPKIDFDDLNWETRDYDEKVAYGQSKLANYLHALGASRKYPSDQLIATSVHPGWVDSPLDQHLIKKYAGEGVVGGVLASVVHKIFLWKGDLISPMDGAQSTLHCVLADGIESGKFYSQFGVYTKPESRSGGWPMELPNPNATEEVADRLWEVSEKLVGISQ